MQKPIEELVRYFKPGERVFVIGCDKYDYLTIWPEQRRRVFVTEDIPDRSSFVVTSWRNYSESLQRQASASIVLADKDPGAAAAAVAVDGGDKAMARSYTHRSDSP